MRLEYAMKNQKPRDYAFLKAEVKEAVLEQERYNDKVSNVTTYNQIEDKQ